MSELRDNLLRAPHVPPAVDVSIQLSDFDQAIVNTNVLNSNLAKDKIRLVNRSRNQRRLGNKHLSATKQRFSSTAPINMDNILMRNRVATKIFEGFGEALFKELIIGLEPGSTIHYTRPGSSIKGPTPN